LLKEKNNRIKYYRKVLFKIPNTNTLFIETHTQESNSLTSSMQSSPASVYYLQYIQRRDYARPTVHFFDAQNVFIGTLRAVSVRRHQ